MRDTHGRVARRAVALASLIALCTPAVVIGLATPASASPAITGVAISGTQDAPTFTVTGSEFGTSPAALGTQQDPGGCGGTGNDYGDNFYFSDDTGSWAAGQGPGDCIGVIFTSYSDTQVVFTLGTFYSAGFALNVHDAFSMHVLGATFSGFVPILVPASAADPNGFDSGVSVNNSITLTATGNWCNVSFECEGPTGDAGFGPGGGDFMLPGVTAFALLGRIGTSGPWTEIGNGPQTLNGSGELYLIMNDSQGAFYDNSGGLGVSIVADLNLGTEYSADGAQLLGPDLGWQGDILNDGQTTQTNLTVLMSGGLASDPPTWQVFGSNPGSGSCTFLSGTLYSCAVPELDPGDLLAVDANMPTAGLVPQTLSDALAVFDDQTGGCFFCGAAVAPQLQQVLDGLRFDITSPAPVAEGDPLTIQGTITNTSPDFDVTGVTVSGQTDVGHIVSTTATGCKITNSGPGGQLQCPDPGLASSFTIPAGQTFPASVTIDTNGLDGQTVNWSVHANSPDLGGDTYTATGSDTVTDALAIQTTTEPVAASVTSGEDAVWSVPIVNNSTVTLTGATAVLHANANGSTPLGFDEAAMPGCSAGAGNSEVCTVPDIPAGQVDQFKVSVPTTGLSAGTTLTGDIDVTGPGASEASGNLDTVTIAPSCGTSCAMGVGVPGQPLASSPGPPTDAHPTKQVVKLPADQPGSAQQPAIPITLNSIKPTVAPASDRKLCPITGSQTRCSGQVSVVAGDFSAFNDKAHPIQLQIITKWKSTVPPGRILMQKDNGSPPVQLPKCFQNPTTHQYNTPCARPEVVKGSVAAHTKTTTDTILFVAGDPHLARRLVSTPNAPTAITATAGVKKAVVQWKAPTVTNGTLTGYVITAYIGTVAKKTVSFTPKAVKETVTGLVSGQTYTFKVVAKNAHGSSFLSVASRAVKIE